MASTPTGRAEAQHAVSGAMSVGKRAEDATSHGDTERPPPVAPVASVPAAVDGSASLPASGARVVTTAQPAPTLESPGRAASAASAASLGAPPPDSREAAQASAGKDPRMTRRCTTCEAFYPADFLVCPRDATPLVDEASSHADPRIAALVGDSYQIVRVIGEGGMGRVYEARHLRLKERRFAIKMLHADLAKNPEIVARFLREAESASSLAHPHVVDVFDVHHLADGTPYLACEFLEGEELAEYVGRRGPLSPAAAAVVGHQICSALAAAHDRGIVHRDMKPENVFVLRASMDEGRRDNLRIKVLDFGISKAQGERTQLTRTGMIMGTPSYMAPEQARGQVVDHRADIYAVGAVLYFALTGHKPFDSEDPTSTLSLVLTREPVRLRTLGPTVPEALELIVQKAMAKEPADRFETMAELARALRSFDTTGELASVAGHPNALPVAQARGRFRIAEGLGAAFGAQRSAALGAASHATYARPTIVVMGGVVAAWGVAATAAALAGAVRAWRGDDLTGTESALLAVACVLASLTPAWLYVTYLRRVVWSNTVRAIEHAGDLRRGAVCALTTYGALALALRVVFTTILRDASAMTHGVWDLALFAVSLVAFGIGGGGGVLLRRRRRARLAQPR